MTEKTAIHTEEAPAPFRGAPYSQAIKTGGLVFVSGQISLRPDHADVVGVTIQEQTEQIMKNLAAILAAAGSDLGRLVKTTVYLTNLDDFQGMNEIYARHVGETPPARATIEVGRLPSGALVEIDAIATV
jgi:2-iminobutanoate/2-iminopropanoate deaminase